MRKKTEVMLAVLAGAAILSAGGCGKAGPGGAGRVSSRYAHAEQYTRGEGNADDRIRNLDLNWLSGSVKIEEGDTEEIRFEEEANQTLDEDSGMYYWVDGDTLRIQYCREGDIRLSNKLHKELYVTVPKGYRLKEVEINTVSASVDASRIRTEDLDISTISGSSEITECAVSEEVEIDTVSGAVNLNLTEDTKEIVISSISGSARIHVPFLKNLELNSTSGDMELIADRAPEKISADTISGKVTLKLPEDLDAAVTFDTISGKFHSEMAAKADEEDYIFGAGTYKYDINTTSGELAVLKR